MPSAARPRTEKVTFGYVKQDDLRFDPTNPRFAAGGRSKSPEQIQALLEREPHLALELVDSFLENGFIAYEPLVVRRENGHYVVVEGNRRLAAIRHILANRTKYEKRSREVDDLQEVPVLVFPEATDAAERDEERVYLGVRHLFGFRDWPAESKARFLDAQIKGKADVDRTMRELNIKRADIKRYVVPFRLRKSARELWKPYEDQDFWVLGEGLNRGGIQEYIELDVDRSSLQVRGFDPPKLKNLFGYIYGVPADGKRIGKCIRETRDLSTLAKVLESKAAANELERGRSLEEASLFIETGEESIRRLQRVLGELRVLLKRILAKQTRKPTTIAPVIRSFGIFEQAAKKFIKDAQKPIF